MRVIDLYFHVACDHSNESYWAGMAQWPPTNVGWFSSCSEGGGGGGGGGAGAKSPFSLLSEPISPSSLLFWANFSLFPTFFGPFLLPPYSVPPPSLRVFLQVLWFSSLHKNQHLKIPIRSRYWGPAWKPAKLMWLPLNIARCDNCNDEVWNFEVKTERSRLISYLWYSFIACHII